MAINVNRVAVGFNCKNYDTAYFTRVAKVCPVSSTAQQDGSFLICKAGGIAWFVAPASTQITSEWANGQYNNTSVGNKCCISEWGVLGSCLSARRYNPTEWFVPSSAQLQNPGYTCRTNWSYDSPYFWSSTQSDASNACFVLLINSTGYIRSKASQYCVRAFRCVTY